MASLPSASLLPSPSLVVLSPTKIFSSSSSSRSIVCSSPRSHSFSSIPRSSPSLRMTRRANHNKLQVVAMAPEEEKLTRRNPLDFPIKSYIVNVIIDSWCSVFVLSLLVLVMKTRESTAWGWVHKEHVLMVMLAVLVLQEWERPKPGRRPDIFPKFSPMKTPLPPPMPYDPPAEDEEEEEEKKEEEEENPDQEEEEQPEKQQ
ncbi:hypothetical protein DY000_02021066 [Brassica cretica]|uniref:Uncharacterized protein n=1 Tax=Brassica cretica TaxID=69181 RepID=A0ABQ7E8J7_BRACR|nr:hypothetical protein DY000_02021066 [Brassica cretica]